MDINGEAIYGTSPWNHQNDTINDNVWYTCTKAEYNAHRTSSVPHRFDTIKAIYAIFLQWPENNILKVANIAPYLHSGIYKVKMLGNQGYLKVSNLGQVFSINSIAVLVSIIFYEIFICFYLLEFSYYLMIVDVVTK